MDAVRETDIRVSALSRFPVKSLTGEELDALDLDARGVVGDRVWSIRTVANKIGSGKNTRRFAAVPGLLSLRARTVGAEVRIALPGGEDVAADDPAAAAALSDFLGQPVSLARESDVSHFDDGPVSIIGAGSLAALAAEVGAEVDPRRFRANLVVEGLPPFGEDELVGRRIRVGGVTFDVVLQSTRCVMIDMETADLPEQPRNLRTLGRLHDTCLGVVAQVVEPGRIRLGDQLQMPD
jgi:uncharacterized protein YcbX